MEARLEAYERGAKRRQGSRSVASAERRAVQRKAEQPSGGMANWPEGQLLPDGWDEMDFGTRLGELYTGKRGLLFWFNKAAYASIFIILGGWVIFRFVLPALGLYSLTNDLSTPPAP
ncbi:hypothetical protein WJX81_001790 [Elliptochloris bilobata]|uniref:Uncharacterized protein n=1 Tax=Elliptochloris bilobata TaxID=381761 RepID=A0AAW1RE61_9CHLO